MIDTVLKKQERVSLALRELFRRYGYAPYKMNKFELYDLYAQNKDFLVGEGVITFTDTDGKLLALKPDVTLSIIKNADANAKVFYDENVYRISGETKQFKEIRQVGLERIGNVSVYDLYETLYLSAQSLLAISERFVLDISHLGVLSAILSEIGTDTRFNKKFMHLLAEKNSHGISALCQDYALFPETTAKLLTLVKTYGEMNSVLKALAPLCENGKAKSAYDELCLVCGLLAKTEYADRIRLDFSVVNDMEYYNGFVFKGFIEGVSEGVLSGGQYDALMERMGRKTGAIGFAVYLDLLEGFGESKSGFALDTAVIYDKQTDLQTIAETVENAVKAGKRVSAVVKGYEVRAREIVDLTGGNV